MKSLKIRKSDLFCLHNLANHHNKHKQKFNEEKQSLYLFRSLRHSDVEFKSNIIYLYMLYLFDNGVYLYNY